MITRIFFTALLITTKMSSASQAVPAFYPDLLKLSAPLYTEIPDLENCQAGKLSNTELQRLLASINTIRQLHGLGPVVLDLINEPAVKQAALMFAANGKIAHNPPATWLCYKAEGAVAASKSIISGGVAAKNIIFYSPEQDIISWLTDINSITAMDIAHRRLLLDPFLQSVAYARVSGRINRSKVSVGSAMMLTTVKKNALNVSDQEIIAYPYHDYPTRYFADGAILSMSVFNDKINKHGNTDVDFSNTSIRVRTENGNQVKLKNIQFDNKYYGLPNNIQFSVGHIERGSRYEVNIENVRVNGKQKSYSYWFRVIPEID